MSEQTEYPGGIFKREDFFRILFCTVTFIKDFRFIVWMEMISAQFISEYLEKRKFWRIRKSDWG